LVRTLEQELQTILTSGPSLGAFLVGLFLGLGGRLESPS